jgi:hypothetical protein
MTSLKLVARDPIQRPGYVWGAIVLELVTAVAAIPVGLSLMADPSGSGIGLPSGWIEESWFADYLIPGVYLFAINGIGMLALAGLSVLRHWSAPWLTGALGVGMIAWIAVQLIVMPETSPLQLVFGVVGLALGFVALLWLRVTGQLRLW